MRNPKRIIPMMNKIGTIWETNCSDWRFGQFLINCLGEMASKHGDPFFWEDDKFIEYLEECFKTANN